MRFETRLIPVSRKPTGVRRALVFGLVLVATGLAFSPFPAAAQLTISPGRGAAMAELLDRNFVTVVDEGTVIGLHPNEMIFGINDVAEVTASPRGQTIFVAGEGEGSGETIYRGGQGQTTFVLMPPRGSTVIEDCLIFDIDGAALSVRSGTGTSGYELANVFVTAYSISADSEVKVSDGQIIYTDLVTGGMRTTNVEWSDGTKVDAATIQANLVINDGEPVPVGPGGSRSLRVVTDEPATLAPSANPREIVVVGSKIKEVVKGSPQTDDVFYVDRVGGVPGLEIDGQGAYDTIVVRSGGIGVTDTAFRITVYENIEDSAVSDQITLVLADFSSEFETFALSDGRTRFIDYITGSEQIIGFVDPDGFPVPVERVPLIIIGVEDPD